MPIFGRLAPPCCKLASSTPYLLQISGASAREPRAPEATRGRRCRSVAAKGELGREGRRVQAHLGQERRGRAIDFERGQELQHPAGRSSRSCRQIFYFDIFDTHMSYNIMYFLDSLSGWNSTPPVKFFIKVQHVGGLRRRKREWLRR